MQKRISRADWLGISNTYYEVTRGQTLPRGKGCSRHTFPNLQITTLPAYLGTWVINGGESRLDRKGKLETYCTVDRGFTYTILSRRSLH